MEKLIALTGFIGLVYIVNRLLKKPTTLDPLDEARKLQQNQLEKDIKTIKEKLDQVKEEQRKPEDVEKYYNNNN